MYVWDYGLGVLVVFFVNYLVYRIFRKLVRSWIRSWRLVEYCCMDIFKEKIIFVWGENVFMLRKVVGKKLNVLWVIFFLLLIIVVISCFFDDKGVIYKMVLFLYFGVSWLFIYIDFF